MKGGRRRMKAEIQIWFEMLTWRFLNLFLLQRPQEAPPFLPAPLLNPPVLLPQCPGSCLTLEKFSPISGPDTPRLRLPSARASQDRGAGQALAPHRALRRVPPILHATPPILLYALLIRHANRPILPPNHPAFLFCGANFA